MEIKKLLLAIFFLGISPLLSAQLKDQNLQELIPAPRKLVFDLMKMDLGRFDFVRLNSKIRGYPVISEKEKTASKLADTTGSSVPESVITITVEDGKLFSHLHPKCSDSHYVQQDDYFFLKAEDADIEFTKDEKGSINLVIKHKAVMPVKK